MATSLFRKPFAKSATPPARARTAIIDIGSNSIRLVVYEGHPRLPAILFNEKVMAGLGRDLADTGGIGQDAMALARTGLARFAAVAHEMDAKIRTVATAAVRDATNGGDLIHAAADLGLEVELLSGEQEAIAAGHGVLSAIPDADGIVGDLGGGSLELVRIVAGTVIDRISLPLGVLRVAAIRAARGKGFARHVAAMIRDAGWSGRGADLPVYLVGGSWRALARLDMHLSGYPLPIIHGYTMSADTVARLVRNIVRMSKTGLRSVPGMSSARAATLRDGAALLDLLMRDLGSDTAIASSFGLREGLLYGALDRETRALDPLIVAAREEGRVLGRFPEHGDLLDTWIAPLFIDEPPDLARLRHAACLLADVGWRANPEFRDERGVEIALHGSWVAIDARGRALLAQALYTSLGGGLATSPTLTGLASATELETARSWGLAIRLGQRFSGGLAGPLQRSTLSIEGDDLRLSLAETDRALYGDPVQRRHATLAATFGLEASVAT